MAVSARLPAWPCSTSGNSRCARCRSALYELADFSANLPGILARPGPVFVALKVLPEVENEPIGRRSRWNTRSRDKVVQDLRGELSLAPLAGKSAL